MKRRFYLFSFLVFGLILYQGQTENLKGADQEIQKILEDYKGVGLSVAIVRKDKVIFSKGFGYRDLENKLPVTSNTLFGIGSNTKAFTSALIGISNTENKLYVKDKPSKYIPHLEFPTDRMNELITIEDLLDHRSGLGSVDGSYIFFPSDKRIDLLNKLPYLKANGEPKNSWIYSNFGYIILGVVAEQVYNSTWEKLINEKIFSPLKMNNSNISVDELVKQKDFSYPYGIYQNKIEKVLFQKTGNDNPGAGINSSANDMANWLKLWLNYGNFEGKRIVSEDYIRNAISTKAIIDGGAPSKKDQANYLFGYGYGWNTNIFHGHYRVYHGGLVSGFSSNVVLFPADGFGIVVLSNQHNTDLPYTVASMLALRMLGLNHNKPYSYEKEIHDISKPEKDIKPVDESKRPTHTMDSYCGEYENKGYGIIKVVKEGEKLYAIFPAFKFTLEHTQYDYFRLKFTEEFPQQMNPDLNFGFRLNGKRYVSELEMDIQRGIIFKKIK
ncbi:MAG: serine hydrolase [Flavobacteriaceae bacterium]|nr:serine hydrolase [Flavobacteriaceae bacterium]